MMMVSLLIQELPRELLRKSPLFLVSALMSCHAMPHYQHGPPPPPHAHFFCLYLVSTRSIPSSPFFSVSIFGP